MSKKNKNKAKANEETQGHAPVQAEEDSKAIEIADLKGLDLEFVEDDVQEAAPSGESSTEGDMSPDESVNRDTDLAFDASEGESHNLDQRDGEGQDQDQEQDQEQTASDNDEMAGTELESFASADIEDLEVLTAEQIRSVVESVLFATDKPLSIAVIKQAFKGTQARSKDIREALNSLAEEYNGTLVRGFTLHEAGGGFQLVTKADNMKYLRQSVKVRPFKLSGPALEVISIVAYKQPVTKAQIDEIRGVESGHLLRALMEKHLVSFGERSDLPGKPMFYETTRKFLEIFGLRNVRELPSLNEIDQLIPEGIGEVEDKETLSDLTGQLSQAVGSTYSEAEDELLKITDELTHISTSSEFFEDEKRRMREKRDLEKAQNIREAQAIGESVDEKDLRWLERYEAALAEGKSAADEVAFVTEGLASEGEGSAVPESAGAEPVPDSERSP